MSAPIKPLTENFAVAPQLGPDDMADGRRRLQERHHQPSGFRGRSRPADRRGRVQAAQAAGLRIEYQPVVGSAMTIADVQRFAELLRTLPGPVLAYCRTGTRCTNLSPPPSNWLDRRQGRQVRLMRIWRVFPVAWRLSSNQEQARCSRRS